MTAWFARVRRVMLAVAAPVMILLFILSIPFVLPFVGIAQARADRRRRTRAETWPCGWCTAPLGVAALARADALFAAHVRRVFPDDWPGQPRVVRDLHACCPRCDGGHRYDEQADCFALLDPRLFARRYANALGEAVPPATAAPAWPWLAPAGPMHRLAATRDGAAPVTIAVPAEADVTAIGEALLRLPGHAGADVAWWCGAGDAAILFGRWVALPFVRRIGAAAPAGGVTEVTVREAVGHDPEAARRAAAAWVAARDAGDAA